MAGSILIRVDSSPAIGAGHMARCRSLAQGFVDRGGKVTFATAQALPGTAELLLPAVADFIVELDIANGRIVARGIEELLP